MKNAHRTLRMKLRTRPDCRSLRISEKLDRNEAALEWMRNPTGLRQNKQGTQSHCRSMSIKWGHRSDCTITSTLGVCIRCTVKVSHLCFSISTYQVAQICQTLAGKKGIINNYSNVNKYVFNVKMATPQRPTSALCRPFNFLIDDFLQHNSVLTVYI